MRPPIQLHKREEIRRGAQEEHVSRSTGFQKILTAFEATLKAQKAPAPLPPKPRSLKRLHAHFKHYEVRELYEWLSICDGISLPSWIGGAVLGSSGNKMLGIVGILDLIGLYDEWPRKDLIPVAADGSGQFFCIVGSEWNQDRDVFPIGFVDAMALDQVEFYVASSLEAFLRSLLAGVQQKEYEWYFNKRRLLRSDPELAHVQRSLLPWDNKRD